MKIRYYSTANYDCKKAGALERKSKKPSATIPDQNYTMREILNKFTSGSPINNMGTYNDYDYSTDRNLSPNEFESAVVAFIPHPKTMDLVDRQNQVDIAIEQMTEKEKKELQAKKDKETKRKEKEKKDFEDKIIKEYEAKKYTSGDHK